MEESIKNRICTQLDVSDIRIDLDGNHCSLSIVSPAFAELNRVRRQQKVYACIADLIEDGSLHAVTIKALAPGEH